MISETPKCALKMFSVQKKDQLNYIKTIYISTTGLYTLLMHRSGLEALNIYNKSSVYYMYLDHL